MTAAAPRPGVDEARRLVQEAVAALAQTEGRPVAEHVPVLDGVHKSLQDALAALDEV